MARGSIDDRPDVCPKGHAIWWFTESTDYSERGWKRWWGVCSGKVVSGRVTVAAACRHTWIWNGRSLESIERFNPETLMRIIRDMAHQMGMFSNPQDPEQSDDPPPPAPGSEDGGR